VNNPKTKRAGPGQGTGRSSSSVRSYLVKTTRKAGRKPAQSNRLLPAHEREIVERFLETAGAAARAQLAKEIERVALASLSASSDEDERETALFQAGFNLAPAVASGELEEATIVRALQCVTWGLDGGPGSEGAYLRARFTRGLEVGALASALRGGPSAEVAP
jgi:hypothetical protein